MQITRRGIISFLLVLMLAGGLLGLLFGLSACEPQPVMASNGIRIASPQELLPLFEAVKEPFTQASNVPITLVASNNRLADLKEGKVDAVLLGREPTRSELIGLNDHVIAYDAVCIVVNERTYKGGVKTSSDAVLFPLEKYTGIQDISLDNLRGYVSRLLGFSNQDWTMTGPSSGKYVFQVNYQINEDGTRFPIYDPESPYKYSGMWVREEIQFVGEVLPTGKFDTQAAMLQKLVIPESTLENPNLIFIFSAFDSEELLVSRRFQILRSSILETPYPFDFFFSVLSRRIVVRALDYKFGLRALSINGIDPIQDPQVIYQGTYPLSQKIHLLTRNPYRGPDRLLVGFFRSPDGQKLIEQAKYLPLVAPPK